MFRSYTYKLIRSPLLYIGILGIIALCCTDFMSYDFFYGNVTDRMSMFLNIGLYRKAMAIFGALPFTANFADEWTSGIALQCVTRRGIKKYAVANILFCWIASMLTVFLGMTIFSVLYSFFIPFSEPYTNPYGFIFGQFLHSGHGEIYLLLRIVVFASSCAMWAVIGMLLSAFFPNRYIAVCAPFVASYVLERITIQFPDNLNLWYISLSFVEFKSDFVGFLYCTGIFTVISAACGICFYIFVRKRVQNEHA